MLLATLVVTARGLHHAMKVLVHRLECRIERRGVVRLARAIETFDRRGELAGHIRPPRGIDTRRRRRLRDRGRTRGEVGDRSARALHAIRILRGVIVRRERVVERLHVGRHVALVVTLVALVALVGGRRRRRSSLCFTA